MRVTTDRVNRRARPDRNGRAPLLKLYFTGAKQGNKSLRLLEVSKRSSCRLSRQMRTIAPTILRYSEVNAPGIPATKTNLTGSVNFGKTMPPADRPTDINSEVTASVLPWAMQIPQPFSEMAGAGCDRTASRSAAKFFTRSSPSSLARTSSMLPAGSCAASVQDDVFGLEDIGNGGHTLLPLHFSFWRRTSGNDRSGSMTNGSFLLLLATRRTSPTCMACEDRPSTETKTFCSGTNRRTSITDRSLTTVERLVSTWGQIGVITNAPESGRRIGPPAASEYAVEPVGVATIKPSAL